MPTTSTKKQAMRFVSRSTRNSHDNQQSVDPDTGRLVTDSTRGVRYRCGLLVTALARGAMSPKAMLAYLRKKTKNESYSEADLIQVKNQLSKHDIARSNNRGAKSTWSLTRNGRERWNTIEKKSV